MIYIPLERSLATAQRISSSKPTKKQIKRARDASQLGLFHIENMVRPVIVALQPWSSPLPFDLNVPIVPYV